MPSPSWFQKLLQHMLARPKGITGAKLKTRTLSPPLRVTVLLTVLYRSRGFSGIHEFPWWFCAVLSQSLLTDSFPLNNYKKKMRTKQKHSLESWWEKKKTNILLLVVCWNRSRLSQMAVKCWVQFLLKTATQQLKALNIYSLSIHYL